MALRIHALVLMAVHVLVVMSHVAARSLSCEFALLLSTVHKSLCDTSL